MGPCDNKLLNWTANDNCRRTLIVIRIDFGRAIMTLKESFIRLYLLTFHNVKLVPPRLSLTRRKHYYYHYLGRHEAPTPYYFQHYYHYLGNCDHHLSMLHYAILIKFFILASTKEISGRNAIPQISGIPQDSCFFR